MPFYKTGKVVKDPLGPVDIALLVDLFERIRQVEPGACWRGWGGVEACRQSPPRLLQAALPHMPACPASCHVQTRHCSPACCSLQAAPDLRGRRPLGPTRHAPHVSAGGSARQPEGAAAASAGGFVQRWEGQQLIGVPPTHPTHLNPTHATHHPQPTFTATQSLNQLTCRPPTPGRPSSNL